jgi:hypothetical protein
MRIDRISRGKMGGSSQTIYQERQTFSSMKFAIIFERVSWIPIEARPGGGPAQPAMPKSSGVRCACRRLAAGGRVEKGSMRGQQLSAPSRSCEGEHFEGPSFQQKITYARELLFPIMVKLCKLHINFWRGVYCSAERYCKDIANRQSFSSSNQNQITMGIRPPTKNP